MFGGSSSNKAQILCLEKAGWDVDAQFNPTTFSYTRSVDWTGSNKYTKDEAEKSSTRLHTTPSGDAPIYDSPWGRLNYTGGKADELNVTLLYDESEYRDDGLSAFIPAFSPPAALAAKMPAALLPKENKVTLVDDKGPVGQLHRLTMPLKHSDNYARPPICAFVWGKFQFQGVISSLSVNFNLFDADGGPRRAEITLKMTGRALTAASSSSQFLEGTIDKLPDAKSSLDKVSGTRTSLLDML